MKIGKKLYVGFGAVLAVLVLLICRQSLRRITRALGAVGRLGGARKRSHHRSGALPDHAEPLEP